MKKTVISILVIGVVGIGVGYYIAQQTKSKIHAPISHTQCAFLRSMEKLWSEHVIWTRQFIVSSVAKIGDADNAAQRLLKNQEDIGNAIVPFYGEEAGLDLTKLLKEHIAIAGDIVKEVIAKNDAKVKELNTQWHRNAADISTFLAQANSLWTQKILLEMFNEHLALTAAELQYRLKGDWKNDITNYDKTFDQALEMGRHLADGIMKQFPEKF